VARKDNPERRMGLGAHFKELRRRLFLAALGILVGAVVGWILFERVFEQLQQPLLDAAARHDKIITINFAGMTSAIDVHIKVALFLAVLITSPWWLYQVWAFITPGLTKREKRYTFGFLGAAVPLFLAGAAAAWFLLPHAVDVLTEFVPDNSSNLTDAQMYLSFVMQLMLAFGLAMVLPVAMVAVNFMGLVRASTWARGWRWAIVVAFLFAAIMTPTPDAWTMILVALPICVLYVVALGVCTLHDRRADKAHEAFVAASV